jgi:hypothetical protein
MRHRAPWTAADDEALRALYADRATSEVARALGRSLNAVRCRAQYFHLLKTAAYIAALHKRRQVDAWKQIPADVRRTRALKAVAAARAKRDQDRLELGARYTTKSHAYLAGYQSGYKRAWSWWQKRFQRDGVRKAS